MIADQPRTSASRSIGADGEATPAGILAAGAIGRPGTAAPAQSSPAVAVVIPCYNHAHYVSQAIASVMAQTFQDFEVIVVDDGSSDNTPQVVAQHPRVKYVRQENQGLSAARNTGIEHTTAPFLVFLDADDWLFPEALEVGLRELTAYPHFGFVSGTYRRVTDEREPIFTYCRPPIRGSHYLAFLRRNYIGMHATVMYRREVFERVGRYDTSLPACEDYDMYLRITREFPVGTHDALVADYRLHGSNMSGNLALMVKASTDVLRRQRRRLKNLDERRAYREGMQWWKEHYTGKMLERLSKLRRRPGNLGAAARLAGPFFVVAPFTVAKLTVPRLKTMMRKLARKVVPAPIRRLLRPRFGARRSQPPIGAVNFGDLRSLKPISRKFGFDRGQPVDRYYIEAFLKKHSADIRGRVLEIGGNDYTLAFGGSRVTQSDVLHVQEGNPQATFVGDLAKGDNLPSDAFDCIIITQTLQLIYDVKAAVATLRRILKPGGALLLTVPGSISQIERGTWTDIWHWGFTELAIRKLLEEQFPPGNFQLETDGNVLVSIAFLTGVAANELKERELRHRDPLYPLVVTARVRK